MSGIARYDERNNKLIVIRKGENIERLIPCTNFNPKGGDKYFGVEINGDEIYLLVGPKNNPRPNKKFIYKFSSLTGGGSKTI